MAVTHGEIYRRLEGELRPRALRFVPITLAGVRVAARRKLPLLLLLAPPAIAGIVYSFLVYAKFTAESGDVPMSMGSLGPAQMIAATMAQKMIQVHEQIVRASSTVRGFALLVIAWFGAGLIAEDRRRNAHLLYFSRPITRLDYYLGHFCTVAWFGLIAVLGPGLLICIVATFSSPDYAFIKEQWNVVLGTIGYSLLYVAVFSAFVLAVSSLVQRKMIALALVFGFGVGTQAVAEVLVKLQRDGDFRMLGLWTNFERLGYWMLGGRVRFLHWDARYSLAIVLGLFVLSLAVTALRLRRLEVVA